MWRIRPLALIIIGVLANNYVYLHDVVMGEIPDYCVVEGTHHQFIELGPTSWMGIVACLVLVAVGLWWAARMMSQISSE